MRRFVNLTLLLVAALVVAFGLLQQWLGRHVTEQVVAELSKAYNGPVRLKGAQMGLHGTTLFGLELFEPDDPHGRPWLQVDQLRTDVNLADALRGQVRPSELRLDRADMTLRFDKEGQLLTRWPTPGSGSVGGFALPRVDLHDSQLRFRRGRLRAGGATRQRHPGACRRRAISADR